MKNWAHCWRQNADHLSSACKVCNGRLDLWHSKSKTIYKNLQETCELRNRDPNLSWIGTQNSNSWNIMRNQAYSTSGILDCTSSIKGSLKKSSRRFYSGEISSQLLGETFWILISQYWFVLFLHSGLPAVSVIPIFCWVNLWLFNIWCLKLVLTQRDNFWPKGCYQMKTAF